MWTPTFRGLNSHMWLVATVSESTGVGTKVPHRKKHQLPACEAAALAGSYSSGPAAQPPGLTALVKVFVKDNELLELFTASESPTPDTSPFSNEWL